MAGWMGLLMDWRFACAAGFLGSILGGLLYQHTPPPPQVRTHVERMIRAGVISALASQHGAKPAALAAGLFGAQQVATINGLLRRQRRQFLAVGLGAAALLLAPTCARLPYQRVPEWIYLAAGAVTAARTWNAWK